MRNEQLEFMREAIRLSVKSVENGGGPFGAVIVKDGQIIAKASNSVTTDNDPTAHAEINAIRKASASLCNFDLSGCEIYTSCEPCPMCLGGIYWSRIDKIYFGNSRCDAQDIGFDDAFIYDEFSRETADRIVPCQSILGDEARIAFVKWNQKENKTEY